MFRLRYLPKVNFIKVVVFRLVHSLGLPTLMFHKTLRNTLDNIKTGNYKGSELRSTRTRVVKHIAKQIPIKQPTDI